MTRLVSTLEDFKTLLLESSEIAAGLLEHPEKRSEYHERLVEIRSTCDNIMQEVIIKGLFPPHFTEIDILRKRYLDLSRELYDKQNKGIPSFESDMIRNMLNSILLKIKQLENTDPSGLILD
jgi:hypothetical protein